MHAQIFSYSRRACKLTKSRPVVGITCLFGVVGFVLGCYAGVLTQYSVRTRQWRKFNTIDLAPSTRCSKGSDHIAQVIDLLGEILKNSVLQQAPSQILRSQRRNSTSFISQLSNVFHDKYPFPKVKAGPLLPSLTPSFISDQPYAQRPPRWCVT
ncbi:hypothetical protein CPB84DRAFT_255987 [Gymnopilus junonius]|uniref:Uncharacterized protein n=1 Tax=Gymnopilus junonius TaxID=109634 RepID=A0A9P5NFY1_GYMJU|nr:hypothetical protein CPB84DRAFT_255987 [Gymnopilus junonius]